MKRPLKKSRRVRKPLRVLIVDDAVAMRKKLAELLAGVSGLVIVGEAQDGQSALEAIRKHAPDLITLDLRMPRKSGLQVLGELGRNMSRRVIVLAALIDESTKEECLKLGARHVFDKTESLDRFLETIASLTHK